MKPGNEATEADGHDARRTRSPWRIHPGAWTQDQVWAWQQERAARAAVLLGVS